MTDSIHLIGAEDVARAGSTIASAAEDMRRTQGWLDESLQRSNNRFEELVERIEAAAEKVAKASERGYSGDQIRGKLSNGWRWRWRRFRARLKLVLG
jgi:hypothetical protein